MDAQDLKPQRILNYAQALAALAEASQERITTHKLPYGIDTEVKESAKAIRQLIEAEKVGIVPEEEAES